MRRLFRMKRLKNDYSNARRFKFSYVLIGLAALYLVLICWEYPEFFESAALLSDDTTIGLEGFLHSGKDSEPSEHSLGSAYKNEFHRLLEGSVKENASVPLEDSANRSRPLKSNDDNHYGRITAAILKRRNVTRDFSVLEKMADEAWSLGLKAWEEVKEYNNEENIDMSSVLDGKLDSCPSWISKNGEDLNSGHNTVFLPCGLAAGSSITVMGTPHYAHQEYVPQLSRMKGADAMVYVSQFAVELQGLKSVVGEDPPKILHLNPRLRGDWSHQPVIEHNTCYRMQWGSAQRCDGIPSKDEDDMLVDGHLRCEKWMRNDIVDSKGSKESKVLSWFERFIGRAKRPEVTWPFPFMEGRMFILTIRAGVEGYHINVGGRHITSFPYRTGFALEDATGLAIKGDVDVQSVHATSLPTSHPSFSPQRVLDFSPNLKSQPLPTKSIQLFIGVLSATNHFAERMAIRKTWMKSPEVKSSKVVVRFFVALNVRKEVNAVLKKEAAYFGDIEVLSFMDRYELVVLKTIAICEFGVQNVTAMYIMKCDDDTFLRLDIILKQLDGVSSRKSLYMGNLNVLHRPLRSGKWAVSYQEWPESIYPPYANGPAYVISNDIANYIVSQHLNRTLRLFKMEDVSMGMWVGQFNSSSTHVRYYHSWKFCQYGCMEGYYTAHYQSPQQMLCLWDNLAKGNARCCNY